MFRRLAVAAVAVLASGLSHGQTPTPEELQSRAIERRAVEAVIWGMPAVNYERMLQAAIANGAKPNQVVYWSRPVNWKNQTLTPNPDTIYLNPFYDTRTGPVVLEIPPADADPVIVGSVDVAWQNALADVGPAGVDKGKGGKYLITPPGYKDKVPDGLHRAAVGDVPGLRDPAVELQEPQRRRHRRCRRARQAGQDLSAGRQSRFDGARGRLRQAVRRDDPLRLDASSSCSTASCRSSRGSTRDKVMIDLLKTIGIEKGKPFKPDAEDEDDPRRSRDAKRKPMIALRYAELFDPPFFEGTHWAVPARQAWPREWDRTSPTRTATPSTVGR